MDTFFYKTYIALCKLIRKAPNILRRILELFPIDVGKVFKKRAWEILGCCIDNVMDVMFWLESTCATSLGSNLLLKFDKVLKKTFNWSILQLIVRLSNMDYNNFSKSMIIQKNVRLFVCRLLKLRYRLLVHLP